MIINPWFIYLYNVITSVKFAMITISSIAAVIIVNVTIMGFSEELSTKAADNWWKKNGLKLIAVSVLFIFIGCLIPNKETILEIAIAKNLSLDTIQAGADVVLEYIQKIIDMISNAVK